MSARKIRFALVGAGVIGKVHAEALSQLPDEAECSTASSTSCTRSPSANDGTGSRPAPMSRTRSAAWLLNECS